MQQLNTSLAIGTIIQNRYKVEDILGKGGFSIVYLVHDLEATSQTGQDTATRFALKELYQQDVTDRVRFAFEGEILTRLSHEALPHIYRVFEGDENQQAFMLLEYIAGPNLEVLRREQPGKRFSLPMVLTLMEPIVEAVAYLHSQQPPVIHRDIKPANIIIPQTGGRAVLVDFGIAKEYEADATTTAVRHCSPGYGAPEQYSSIGTDPSTDIYGLAATYYALLTGTVPVDAFQRATRLASRKTDPLTPMNELVSTIPCHIANTITRAMSIGQEQRFSTVEEFRQTLHANTEYEEHRQSGLLSSASSSQLPDSQAVSCPKHRQTSSPRTSKHTLFASLILALMIIIGFGFSLWTYSTSSGVPNSAPDKPTLAHVTPTVNAASPTADNRYPHLAKTYAGKARDLLTQTNSNMSLTSIQQENVNISGSFTGLRIIGAFTGVLDASKHIFFTVAGTTNHPSIFFEGAVRSDGNIAGNYCNIDTAGQCIGSYGIWSIAPGS